MLIFFSLSIDLSTALHGSEGFQCVSQIPVKLTLIYPVIWLFIVALFFPVGLDVTHGFMLAFSNTACAAGLIARWSARSLLWEDFFYILKIKFARCLFRKLAEQTESNSRFCKWKLEFTTAGH